MNKSDLIEKIVEGTNLPRKRAEAVVNHVFDSMTAALVRGDRIEIRGFGSFVSKHYRARTGRNPRTGATIHVAAKRTGITDYEVGLLLNSRDVFKHRLTFVRVDTQRADHVNQRVGVDVFLMCVATEQ